MSVRLQIIVGVVIFIGMVGIFSMVQHRKLNLKYALLWIFAGSVVLILDIFPEFLGIIAKVLGIELPINMLFGLTIKVSKISDEVKRLTQEMAILQYDIEEKQKNAK